jgi:hypothetical protein
MKLKEEKNVHMAYIITCAQWCEHLNISTPCAETLDDHKVVSLEKRVNSRMLQSSISHRTPGARMVNYREIQYYTRELDMIFI